MTSRFVTIRIVLFSMLFLQLVWLEGIWITGASDNWQKLLIVAGCSISAYLAVNLIRDSVFEKIGNWIDWLAAKQIHFFILLAAVLLTLGGHYAAVQRVWRFDEVQNFRASKLIAQKGIGEFFERYARNNYLANRHPPLIFMVNGLAMSAFGVSIVTIRMATLLFGFGMLVASYFLAASIYGKKAAVLTVIFLLSFPLIIRESTAGLLDIQATFFFTLTLLLAVKLVERPSWKLGVMLGLSLGLGLLTKYMVMFIIPVLMLFFLVQRNRQAIAVPVILSFSVASALFLLWTWFGSQIGVRVPTVAGISPSDLFATKQLIGAAAPVTGEVIEEITISPGYFLLSEWGRGFLLNSLITRLPSGLGAYALPLILLGLLLQFRQRKPADLYVMMWVGAISLLLVLTLPDHRYFMVIFPALAIIGARWAEAQPSADLGRVTALMLVYQIGCLFIFVDWSRGSELFMSN